MKANTKFYGPWAALSVAAITLLSLRAGESSAAPALVNLNLANAPLFLSADIKPNLIMAIDDSGSMDFEVSLPGNDGAAWWRTAASDGCLAITANSFTGCAADGTNDIAAPGVPNFNNDGNANLNWLKYAYLFPNGVNGANNSHQRRLGEPASNAGSGGGDHFAIAPLAAFAWTRSPEWNRAYFDPTLTYTRWVDGGGFTFANANPTATRWDPIFGTGQVINLTRDVASAGQVDIATACNASAAAVADGWTFRVFTGMVLPEGTCLRFPGRAWEQVRPGQVCQVGVANGCRVGTTLAPVNFTLTNNRAIAIRYFPATFYLRATEPLPATFGYTGTPLNGVGPGGEALLGYEIKPGNFADVANYNAMMQNFANWFQYYRKRHQSLRNGLGRAFAELGGMRVAGFPINSPTVDVVMGDLDVATDKDSLFQDFYVDWVRSGGTPNRLAVANIIRNFRRTNAGAPVTHSCQKNFGMLFTDGFSNPRTVGDALDGIAGGNADGTAGDPYQDTTANTMADAVWRAYSTPLRTGAGFPTGRVQVPKACEDSNPDPRLDCNDDLHMNFYAVTLNTRGLEFDPDADPAQDPYVTTPMWPTVFPQRHPSAVDDIWHATINGRGRLLNARRPSEIADRLGEVLTSILAAEGSAASAAVNSTSINQETQVFQAQFDSGDWTGKIIARGVGPSGELIETGPRAWESDASSIRAPNDREIVTMNPNGDAVPFRWSEIETAHQTALAAFNGNGERTLEYLRGDQSWEADRGIPASGFVYRTRTELLGDIVNSSPVFVGRPAFRYRDSLESKPYSEFKAAQNDRTGVLYVGANDGMLHAFTALGGEEIFAYIPGAVVKNLAQLADPDYTHRYFVDGSPTAGDAFFAGDWHTVLVGGLNNGGQAIYALNITDPADLKESSASSVAMWEFTDEDDADLGFTYSRPAIVRLRNGKWAAVFGNGYNSTVSDGHASTTGNAVLFIVDIETGDLIRKIDTEFGYEDGSTGMPNGLATPSLVDLNADGIVDIGYAGDLYGNMWKFDLRSTDKDDWDVAHDDGSGNKAPVFVARDDSNVRQPITVRPEVVRGPKGRGLMVLFGTGKYLEGSDEVLAGAGVQSFYGIWDKNSGASTDIVTGRSVLTEQSIAAEDEVTIDGEDTFIRETTSNALGSNVGWYIDLVSPAGFQAEKQVTDPVVRNGRVIFTTLVPDVDPCVYGGTSWLMALDAINGSVPQPAPFEVSDDVSGIQTAVGITPKPAIVASDTKEYAFLPGTKGSMQVIGLNTGPGELGRQSWRQVR